LELVKEAGERPVELTEHGADIYQQGEVAKFLATASADGVPNVVLIVSQTPVDPGRIAFGEFMMVKTKTNLGANPKVASIALTPKLEIAGYKGELQEWIQSGPYVDRINSIEFFRYNAYGGIHNVAVVNITELLPLPERVSFLSAGLEFAAMRTVARLGGPNRVGGAEIPRPIRQKLNSIMSIKVIAFIDENGDPGVVPAFGVYAGGSGGLRFKISGYNNRLRSLAVGSPVAINVLTLELITYQLKGTLVGFENHLGLQTGVVKIEQVYSCAPPLVAQRIL
jgi:hypothetical protein